MSFFEELKRRNVFRVGIAYVVVAWLILQVADVVLPNIPAPGWIFQVILFLLGIGFPIALVLAWAFELTAEGVKRDAEIDRPDQEPSERTASYTGRQLDFAIIALLTLALGYFAFDKFVLSPSPSADKSIAVLPFVNTSEEPEQEYFADGLSEELLNLLAKIPALRVIARTSSFSYKDKQLPIPEISRELNVDHVLEGSVRKSGTTVRISVQLVQGSDSSNLWSERYDAELNDIFAVQDRIAIAVVEQLKVSLLGAVPTAQKTDPQAYALYLQARELARQSTPEGHEQSIALYQQALEIVPGYAAAWAGLADSYIFLTERVLRPREVTFGLAEEAAKTALQHDPDYAPAHASLGRIAMNHDNDLAKAAGHLERALALDPTNPHIINQAANLSANLNRLDEAIALLEYAAARDPVNSGVHSNLALNYYNAGRLDESIAAFQTGLSLSPDAVGPHSWLGAVYLRKNDPAAAFEAMHREPSEPWRIIGLAMVHHAQGQSAEASEILEKLTSEYGDEWQFNIAYVMAYLGKVDEAFYWLQEAIEYNDPGLSEIVRTPEFDNIKSDPRWLPLLESIGKAPRQLDAIEFTVTRPE